MIKTYLIFSISSIFGERTYQKIELNKRFILTNIFYISRTVKIPCVENGNEYREILLKIDELFLEH